MLETISSEEITEWKAYEAVAGPLGDERFDQLHAMMSHLVVMVNGGKKAKRHSTEDFLPPWHTKRKQRQTPNQMKTIMRALRS